MEANDILSVAGSSNRTLNDLSDNVLRELFSHVPTNQLISVWRLVSTKWSRFASDLCRQRSVRLRSPRPEEIFNVPIGQIVFTNPPPFSAATLTLDSSSPECHAFSNHVAKRFGEHFKTARIYTSLVYYAAFFDTLRRTPNLETLEIQAMSDSEEEDFTFLREKIVLPELKSLKMVYRGNGHFRSILEMCFRDLASQLDAIELRFDTGCIGDAEFERCAELVSSLNFSKTSLALPFEAKYSDGWRVLVAKGPFDIQTLEVMSYDAVAELEEMTFDLMVPFLANCRGLTSLGLHGFGKRLSTSKLCRVPAMPTLKKLELTDIFEDPQDGRLVGQLQFEPLQAPRFPSLTEVVVDCHANCDGIDLSAVDVRQIFDVSDVATDRFTGVTSLDVGSTRSATNWADLFPNVTKLSASLEKAEYLASIFTNMTQVTELDLELEDVFLGILKHVRSLKKLKMLTLRLYELEDEIAMFAALSPLNLKIVYNKYELSDSCLSLLRSRHLSVELLKKVEETFSAY